MLKNISYKEILGAITKSIDIINPILKNHHRRVAIISYYIGRKFGLERDALANLVLAALIHDVGALTIRDGQMLKKMDVEDRIIHSKLGAKIFSSYSALEKISKIIRNHHIYYTEYKNRNELIPFEALILHLADRIEISLNIQELSINQAENVVKIIEKEYGTMFDPKLVSIFEELSTKDIFWFDIDNKTNEEIIDLIDIDLIFINHDFNDLENLVYTLSRIIDYKSAFTVTHSIGVAHVAYNLGRMYGLDEETCKEVKIAGYLHDIGKIAISTELLIKPKCLSKNEFNEMKSHVYFTQQILEKIKGFENITKWASSHHETLDGRGYPCSLEGKEIPIEATILAYSDVFCALCEERPYREAMSLDRVKRVLNEKFKRKLGEEILHLLENKVEYFDEIRQRVQKEAYQSYIKNIE